ncbi:F-box/kelch-repeat protein At1g80440-like [Andrographis paniculata]|uniref:F-box/kelch-repeat protein At1g80440-like n=1 Tax=Andrographis paniculata TaxID=175694 RepID=UPI0021E7BF81|nr:F-box/kelch-repeat protein At1g80440-like [Andrographis paniculata]
MGRVADVDLIPGLPYDVGLECLVRIPHQCFSSVASVCKSWKRQIQASEFWRVRQASGLTNRVIVMAQTRFDPTREVGVKKHVSAPPVYRLTLCEPATGYWAELPALPGYPHGLPLFCQVVGVGSDLVVMGGCDPGTWEVWNGVYLYNFVTATWRRGADMPGGKRLFFACAADAAHRTVFVAGGHDGEKCALKSAMAYDVAEDKWTDLPDMAKERDEAKGLFRRGQFLVVGGYPTDAQGRFETTAESFDPAERRWSPVEDDFLDNPTCPRNCLEDDAGNLFLCRGNELLALEGSTWRIAAELPAAVRNTAFAAAWEGKVAVFGSEGFGAHYQGFVLDLKTGKWVQIGAKEEFSGHVLSGCCLEL